MQHSLISRPMFIKTFVYLGCILSQAWFCKQSNPCSKRGTCSPGWLFNKSFWKVFKTSGHDDFCVAINCDRGLGDCDSDRQCQPHHRWTGTIEDVHSLFYLRCGRNNCLQAFKSTFPGEEYKVADSLWILCLAQPCHLQADTMFDVYDDCCDLAYIVDQDIPRDYDNNTASDES